MNKFKKRTIKELFKGLKYEDQSITIEWNNMLVAAEILNGKLEIISECNTIKSWGQLPNRCRNYRIHDISL